MISFKYMVISVDIPTYIKKLVWMNIEQATTKLLSVPCNALKSLSQYLQTQYDFIEKGSEQLLREFTQSRKKSIYQINVLFMQNLETELNNIQQWLEQRFYKIKEDFKKCNNQIQEELKRAVLIKANQNQKRQEYNIIGQGGVKMSKKSNHQIRIEDEDINQVEEIQQVQKLQKRQNKEILPNEQKQEVEVTNRDDQIASNEKQKDKKSSINYDVGESSDEDAVDKLPTQVPCLQQLVGQSINVCKHCGKSFINTIVLQNHMREKHQIVKEASHSKKFKILQIDYKELNQNQLKYTCRYCGIVTHGDLKMYRMHLMQNHEKFEMFKCVVCKGQFADLIDLTRHLLGIHSKKYRTNRICYTCPITNNQFLQERTLMEYIQSQIAYHAQTPDGFEDYGFK